jgi:hypothetical protein
MLKFLLCILAFLAAHKYLASAYSPQAQFVRGSTKVTPKKPQVAPGIIVQPESPASPGAGEFFRTIRDLESELEDIVQQNDYIVILYNDPINKRQYVQQVLMDVFSWDENRASTVMMQVRVSSIVLALFEP